MKSLHCLRCDAAMRHFKTEKLQLGETGWLLGDLPNLFAGSLEVDIYICPKCGKIEFFQAEAEADGITIQQKKCPECGKTHDIDYPKCPFCKHRY